jgi:hypothetical protein
VAKAEQFALDPLIAPAGVIAGHPFDERGDLCVDRWPPMLMRVGPVPADQAPVPAQQRSWCDQPVGPQRLGEELGQRGDHGPVGPVWARLWAGAAQHGYLLAEHQDLGVLGCRRPCEQCDPFGDADKDEVHQA